MCALLKHWNIIRLDRGQEHLTGYIYNHKNKARFPDGKKITTSRIVLFDGHNKVLTLSGSKYTVDLKSGCINDLEKYKRVGDRIQR